MYHIIVKGLDKDDFYKFLKIRNLRPRSSTAHKCTVSFDYAGFEITADGLYVFPQNSDKLFFAMDDFSSFEVKAMKGE